MRFTIFVEKHEFLKTFVRQCLTHVLKKSFEMADLLISAKISFNNGIYILESILVSYVKCR